MSSVGSELRTPVRSDSGNLGVCLPEVEGLQRSLCLHALHRHITIIIVTTRTRILEDCVSLFLPIVRPSAFESAGFSFLPGPLHVLAPSLRRAKWVGSAEKCMHTGRSC